MKITHTIFVAEIMIPAIAIPFPLFISFDFINPIMENTKPVIPPISMEHINPMIENTFVSAFVL